MVKIGHRLILALNLSFSQLAMGAEPLCPQLALVPGSGVGQSFGQLPGVGKSRWQNAKPLEFVGTSEAFLGLVRRDIGNWEKGLQSMAERSHVRNEVADFGGGFALSTVADLQTLHSRTYFPMFTAHPTPYFAELAVGHLLLADIYVGAGEVSRQKAIQTVFGSYDQLRVSTNFVVTFHEQPAQSYDGLIQKWLPGAPTLGAKMKKIVGIGRAVLRTKQTPSPAEIDTQRKIFDEEPFQGKRIVELSRVGLFERSPELRAIHNQRMIEAALAFVPAGEEDNYMIVGALHDPELKSLWKRRYGLTEVDGFQNIPLDPSSFSGGTVDIVAVDAKSLRLLWLAEAQRILANNIAQRHDNRAFARDFFGNSENRSRLDNRLPVRELVSFRSRTAYYPTLNFFSVKGRLGDLYLNYRQGQSRGKIPLHGKYRIIKNGFELREGDPTSFVDVAQVNLRNKNADGSIVNMTYAIPMFTGAIKIIHEHHRASSGDFGNSIRFELIPSAGEIVANYQMDEGARTKDEEHFIETLTVPVKDFALYPQMLDTELKPWEARFYSKFPTEAHLKGETIYSSSAQHIVNVGEEYIVPGVHFQVSTWNFAPTGLEFLAANNINKRWQTSQSAKEKERSNLFSFADFPRTGYGLSWFGLMYLRSKLLVKEQIPLDIFFDELGFERQP